MDSTERKGPLTGIRVLEIASIGPGPFCAMLLADLGAEVIRIDRAARVAADGGQETAANILNRGRRNMAVDLHNPEAIELILRMSEEADAVIEGFRPGVMERLGLGPEVVHARNESIIYGRMTGWGQEGTLAHAAGHDINYIALTGALHHIGPKERPTPPLNLVGDFGGGGLLLAFGVLAALLERQTSGKGQVIDAAMVDGASTLMATFHGQRYMPGGFSDVRGTNGLDGGAFYYNTYETADGKFVAIGSIEPQFYEELLRLACIDPASIPARSERGGWPDAAEKFEQVFKSKTRDEWCAILEGSDACFAPVLTIPEATEHPHNVARNSFQEIRGVKQPVPAPRFSRTPGEISGAAAQIGQHSRAVLADFGISEDEIARLEASGAVRQAPTGLPAPEIGR